MSMQYKLRADRLAELKRALETDWRWWSENRDDMNERFSAWLAR